MKEASPEDLIRSTKPVTLATAKVVAAGNSGNQEDIAAAANMGRNAVTELLTTCKVWDYKRSYYFAAISSPFTRGQI